MFVPALPICTANLVSFPWRTDFSFLGSFCFFLSGSSSSLSGCISTVPPSFVFPTENTGSQRNIQPSKLILQVQSGWFHSYRPTADSEIKARFWINVSLSNKTIFNKLLITKMLQYIQMTDVKLVSILPAPRTPHTFQSSKNDSIILHHVEDFQDVVSTTDCTSAFLSSFARIHKHREDSQIERGLPTFSLPDWVSGVSINPLTLRQNQLSVCQPSAGLVIGEVVVDLLPFEQEWTPLPFPPVSAGHIKPLLKYYCINSA